MGCSSLVGVDELGNPVEGRPVEVVAALHPRPEGPTQRDQSSGAPMRLLIIFLALEAVPVFGFIRNHLVYRERMRVLDRIHELALVDVGHDEPFSWRYELFESVSYRRMVFSLRPVRSFFAESPALGIEVPAAYSDLPS